MSYRRNYSTEESRQFWMNVDRMKSGSKDVDPAKYVAKDASMRTGLEEDGSKDDRLVKATSEE